MDKQSELSSINLSDEISKCQIDSDQKITHDLSLVNEITEKSSVQNCVDDVHKHQIDLVQPSLNLNVIEACKGNIVTSDIKESAKDAISSEISSQELVELTKCADMSNVNQMNSSILETKSEETKTVKDCSSSTVEPPIIQESGRIEIEQESERKIVEENQTEPGENCQSMSTPFSSDNNECLSEEEVYSEVEEIVDSDHYLAVASEDEEDENDEESRLEIENECGKTINSLIENVEKTESDLIVVCAATLPLSSNACEAHDDPMSEEEVYEEIVDDSDEELVLDKQMEINDEVDSNIDGGLPDGVQLAGTAIDVRVADDSTSEIKGIDLEELESKPNAELKESAEEDGKIVQTSEAVSDGNLESELLVVEEESVCHVSGEPMDAVSEDSVSVDITDKSEVTEMANPTSNLEEEALNSTEKVNLEETSRALQNSAKEEDMDVSDEVGSSVDNAVKSHASEVISPSFNVEGNATEEMNLEKTVSDTVSNDTIDDCMDVSDEVLIPVDGAEKSEANKVDSLSLNVEGTVRDATEKVKQDVEKGNGAKTESAKVEANDTVISDDEFDTLVENFYDNNENSSVEPEVEPPKQQSDSEDEIELLIEDFNAANSDDDCLIVEDTSKVIVINDDIKKKSTKQKDNKSSFVGTGTNNLKKDSSEQVLGKKDLTTAEVKLNSESNDTKVKLKDTNVKSLSSATHLNSEMNKKEITVSNSVDANSSSVEKDSVQTDNEFSSNYGLFTKTCEEFVSCAGNVKEDTKAIGNEDLTNQSTTIPSGSVNNTNVKDADKQEDNDKEAETDEIVIDKFGPYKMASESISNSTPDSSVTALNIEESRKRAFDEIDVDTTDVGNKKFKDSFSEEISNELDSSVQEAVRDKVKKLIPQESSFKFITTKKILDRIAMDVLAISAQDIEPFNHRNCRKLVDEAAETMQILDEDFQLFNAQVTDFVTTQEETFQKKKFNPQECDFPPSMYGNWKPNSNTTNPVNKAVLPIPASKSVSIQPVPLRPNPTSAAPRPAVPRQQTPVRRLPPPAIITNASTRPRQAVPGQRFAAASPNVTIAGNPLATLTNSVTNRPFTPRPAAVPSRPQAPINKSTIDLTNEGAMNKRTIASSIASVPTNTVSNLTGQQNVLVPISNFLQMLPNTKSISQISTGNQVQTVRQPGTQPSQQTILQPIRQGMLPPGFRPNPGSRTFTYFMPSNSSRLPNFGGRGGLPIPPFLSASNPGATVFVRMTAAAAPPPMSSIVNSSSRMSTPSQSILNTTTSTTATTATSHGLVLFPRAVKHPAPYFPSPNYPLDPKLKLIPPKPSLKGSKAPTQGIILSWNMQLHSSHAEIAKYQLFAYQESSGLVTSTLWKKVGDVKALPLPMACTLTQFLEGNRYYFGVRALDVHGRLGPYSDPVSIMYTKKNDSPTSNK